MFSILTVLQFVPLLTSLTLGIVFLVMGEARPATKAAGATVFVLAVYLEFFTSHSLAGLLIQSALALGLVAWRKVNAP